MKKIVGLLVIAFIVSCKSEPKDYVTISGTITNQNSDSLFVYQGRAFSKTIKVNEDGTFSDTLKVTAGVYGLYDGNESGSVFLRNGYDLKMTLNTKEFDETLLFSGIGAESSNYLAKRALLQEDLISASVFDLEEPAFKAKLEEINTTFSEFLGSSKNLDSVLIANQKMELTQFPKGMMAAYEQQKQRANMFVDFIGKPAPKFEGYENVKGGKTSLEDLKGKYVYIDVWATWCGPCLREIPSLKEVEKEYHDKNIEFVSISVDDGRGFKGDAAAARIGWKEMVAEKSLGGTQLLSDKGWQSDFISEFRIKGIPRFLLIDPKGVVVNADAPRPSSSKLRTLLNSLNM
jgi:thiol-disulfide isomerase/thioredoxin